MSTALKHTLGGLLVFAGGGLSALQSAHPAWQWCGIALAVVGWATSALARAPGDAATIAGLKRSNANLTARLGEKL